ncbi:MAG: TonB family protein [Spirochaetota bacterium]
MQSPIRDRHIISILTALVLHSIIVLLLGLVDLDRDLLDDQRLGPVAVRFEHLPSERLPRPAEPEPTESPRTAEPPLEEVPEAEQQQAPPAAAQDRQQAEQPASQSAQGSQAAQASQPAPQSSDQQAAEEEWTIPTPSGRSWEEAPRTDRRRTPSSEPSEQTPASESLEGRQETSPAPESGQSRSSGSQIVYGDEEQPDQSGTDRSRDEAAAQSETQPDQDRSVFSDETLQDLESVQGSTGQAEGMAEGNQGRTTGETGTTGQTSGSGQGQAGPTPTEGSSPVEVDVEGPRTRTLRDYSLPELTEEELAELPGRVEVVVSFQLPPSGRPTDLNPEVSSGIVRVDQKVMQAVRTWTFSEAPRDAETVSGRARIIIRAAD